MLFDLLSCNKAKEIWMNKDFKTAIDNYYSYLDSIEFDQDYDFILIDAIENKDSTIFEICLYGGSYCFLSKPESIVDFLSYRKFDVLLVGDYPNEIVNIEKNRNLNTIQDIVKIRYPNDYTKYLKNKHSIGPLIYDYMDMTLVFRNNKLISCKRQYH